jgi:hypothetical protein
VPELEVATVPLQPSEPVPPLAVHAVAFEVDQAADSVSPTSAVVGVTVNALIVGGSGAAVTLRVTDTGLPVPPGPVQVNV